MGKDACSTAMAMHMKAYGLRTTAMAWPNIFTQMGMCLLADMSTTEEKV